MEQNMNELQVVEQKDVQIVEDVAPVAYGIEELREMAQMAEESVKLMAVIEHAVPKLTRAKSWVILGDKPYLLADAAKALALQFGISWQLIKEERFSDGGYPAFTFTYRFSRGQHSIEVFGGRSGRDEFFTGSGKYQAKKGPDEIDWLDVKKAAETNAINRGLRIMLPGFSNLDVDDLEAAGLDIKGTGKGVAYKEGNKGGKTQAQRDEGLKCVNCGAAITQAEASYSKGKFGKHLCRSCQKNPNAVVVEEVVPEEPAWMKEAPLPEGF